MAIRHRVLRIERLFLSWKFPAALAAALAVAVYRWITILKQRASRHKRYLQLLKQNSSFRAGPKDSQGVLAILGGGITGLAAAWHAKRLRPNLSVHLFEKDSDLGGNIKTKDFGDGVRIELGPRSLRTTTKSAKVALQVISLLGLDERLVFADKTTRGRRYVYDPVKCFLEEMPTKFGQILSFSVRHNLPAAIFRDLLLGFKSIMRSFFAAQDSLLSGQRLEGGSLASCHQFFTRHFSQHFADRFVTSLVHGIFSGDAKQLLIKYAFPALWQTEAAYDSVILGSILDPFLKLSNFYDETPMPTLAMSLKQSKHIEQVLKKAYRERVTSLAGGLGTLIHSFENALTSLDVQLHKGTVVTQMAKEEDAITLTLQSQFCSDSASGSEDECEATETSETLQAHAIISTLPPNNLSELLSNSLDTLSLSKDQHRRAQTAVSRLQQLTSLSISVVTLVYPGLSFDKLAAGSDQAIEPGFGFLMPEFAQRGLLLGVVYDSCVFANLGGSGNGVLTAMFGGSGKQKQATVEAMSNTELLSMAEDSISQFLGINVQPTHTEVTRWTKAIPQFDATYSRARAGVTQLTQESLPWLFVAGKAFGTGVGVNDCLLSGLATAEAACGVFE